MSSPPLSRRRLLGATAAGALSFPFIPAFAKAADGWQPVMLPQAHQRDIASALTGGQYRIFVSVPGTPPPAGGHPVLYALDGNASFPVLALLARNAARRAQATKQAPPIVVGIGYVTDNDYDSAGRSRDYTPPSGDGTPAGEGGSGRFLDFIERELKPLVASLAPVDPQRQALFGHSYGGLCVLHALFTRPSMFQTWIAASPSIWYGERVVLGGLAGFSERVAALAVQPSVMLVVGELEQPAAAVAAGGAGAVAAAAAAMPAKVVAPQGAAGALAGTSTMTATGTPAGLAGTPAARDAIRAQRRMVDEVRELDVRLRGMHALARVQAHVLPDENHGSVMLPALSRGIEFFLG